MFQYRHLITVSPIVVVIRKNKLNMTFVGRIRYKENFRGTPSHTLKFYVRNIISCRLN